MQIVNRDRPWWGYPIGTKAPCLGGGHWVKVKRGWMWHNGDIFPRPSADNTGKVILPDRRPSRVRRNENDKHQATASTCMNTRQIASEPLPACAGSPLVFVCVDCQQSSPIGSGEWTDNEGNPFMCKQCCDRHDKKYVEEQSRKARRRLAVRLIRRGTNLKRRDIPNALVDLKVAQLNLKKLICQHHKTSTNLEPNC